MNTNWSFPTLSTLYSDFLTQMKSRDEDNAIWFDGSTATNLPTGTKRWSSTGNKFEKFNGTAWSDLTTLYNINVATANNLNGGNNTTLLGSIPYQSNTNTTTLLSPNTAAIRKFLRQTGTGTNGAVPVWDTLTAADVGLERVTNESKATMFTNPTFTGTVTASSFSGNLSGNSTTAGKLNPLSGDSNYKLAYTADGQRTNAGEWGRAVMRYEPNGQTYGIRVDRADYADSAGTASRAYPRRSDGTDMNFYWSGQSGQPSWIWGGNDGSNMYVWNPSNFSVNYAASAGTASSATGITYNAAAYGNAQLATGEIGTYALLAYVPLNSGVSAGTNYAGSNLRYAGISDNNLNTTEGNLLITAVGTPSGTWRAMGHITALSTYEGCTLFLRIA